MTATVLFLVKLALMMITGILGYLGIVTDYKDENSKLTKWGHRARIGIAVSATLSIVLLGLEQFQAISDAGEAARRLEVISAKLEKTLAAQQENLTTTKDVASGMKASLSTQQQLLTGNETISSDVKENLDKQLNLLGRTGLILKEQNNAIAQQQYLREQQSTLLNNLTSADSYCYLMPSIYEEGSLTLTLAHQGNYPIYDALINIRDLDSLVDIEKKIEALSTSQFLEYLDKNTTVFDIRTVIPKVGSRLGVLKFQGTTKRYHVSIFTRYRHFDEDIQLTKVNGGWSMAYRVQETATQSEKGGWPPPKLLLTQVSDDFPRDKDGKVEWEREPRKP